MAPNRAVYFKRFLEFFLGEVLNPGEGRDARRKLQIKPLKETNLGVAQAALDH